MLKPDLVLASLWFQQQHMMVDIAAAEHVGGAIGAAVQDFVTLLACH